MNIDTLCLYVKFKLYILVELEKANLWNKTRISDFNRTLVKILRFWLALTSCCELSTFDEAARRSLSSSHRQITVHSLTLDAPFSLHIAYCRDNLLPCLLEVADDLYCTVITWTLQSIWEERKTNGRRLGHHGGLFIRWTSKQEAAQCLFPFQRRDVSSFHHQRFIGKFLLPPSLHQCLCSQ